MFRYSLILMVGLSVVGNAAAGWADGLFDELQRDFGSVPRGPTLTHAFRITNKTTNPIHIAGVRVSCGCVSATAMQEDLAPGQSTAILANMDSRRFTGPKSVTIFVSFDRPQWDEVHLVVQANGRDDVMLTPESMAFGQIRRGQTPNLNLNISFLNNPHCRIQDIRSESNYVIPAIKETRRDDGEVAYQLTARIRQDVPVGKWYTDIWLTTNNPSTPRVRVPLTVEVQTALSVSPPSATLGQVKAGETAERKVVVRGSKPFRIIGVRGTDAQITIQDSAPESKPVHVLTVKFKAAKPGEQSWNIHVFTDMKEDAEVEFQAKATVVNP
jgi:hypothetical protein